MIISDCNNIDYQKWNDFVGNNPNGTIFQSPVMYNFFCSVKNYSPVIMAVLNDQGEIHGILMGVIQQNHDGLLGSFSRRAIVWGGPLLSGNGEDHLNEELLLRAFVQELKRRSIYIEFRNLFDMTALKEGFEKKGFAYKDHLNFIVDTATKETIDASISSNRKRQIKKSISKGTRIVEAENLEQVQEFYRILQKLYREKVQKPLPDWSFFEKFYLSVDKLGIILLVVSNNNVIGGILCPIFNKEVLYEWYVCGMDEEYPELYPSVMATWAAIDYALKNGYKRFDFMGAGSPEQDYGVREFKARFGGEMVNFGRFMRINNRLLYTIGRLGLKILGKLKKT